MRRPIPVSYTHLTTGVNLGGANGQGALAGNLNINGGTAVLAAASFLDGSD